MVSKRSAKQSPSRKPAGSREPFCATVPAPADAAPTPIERLRAHRSRRLNLDRDEFNLVDALRQEGVSWSTIGAGLGVSGQAAQQKHTRLRIARR